MLRTIKYGLHGAVVAGLIAAPVLWSSVDKTVHLTVDGRDTAVHTTDRTVGEALADAGYHIDSHDIVAPTPTARIKDGSHIVLRRGRLLNLDVDGRRAQVWTTAPTVAAALDQLGYTTEDFVSVSRSKRLPLSPTALAIRRPHVVTVVHDGQRQNVTTTDATVGQLLADIGVRVGSLDRLSQPPTSALADAATITVQRVEKRTVDRLQTVPYETRKQKDGDLTVGQTKVVSKGRKGQNRVTYSVVFVDGKAAGETRLKTVALADPADRVEHIGTKKPENPDPESSKAIAKQLLAGRGWSDQFGCLESMWNRESGWRTNAANPSGAYGIPQALPGSKMSSAGPDWQTDAETQIKWGLNYIADRYGDPCGAWGFWQAHNYY